MTRLFIIRHGNTFGPDDIPTRVGALTDLPLVQSGITQAKSIGAHFKEQGISPDYVVTSELQRTKQTADYILKELGSKVTPEERSIFNEINYGPDENKPEKDVIARIGSKALELWDKEGIVPQGWEFDPDEAISNWQRFGTDIVRSHSGQTVMVVTSNGIARFAPHLLQDFKAFSVEYSIKLRTGSFAEMIYHKGAWHVQSWNVRPPVE